MTSTHQIAQIILGAEFKERIRMTDQNTTSE